MLIIHLELYEPQLVNDLFQVSCHDLRFFKILLQFWGYFWDVPVELLLEWFPGLFRTRGTSEGFQLQNQFLFQEFGQDSLRFLRFLKWGREGGGGGGEGGGGRRRAGGGGGGKRSIVAVCTVCFCSFITGHCRSEGRSFAATSLLSR